MLIVVSAAWAFCGTYVGTADAPTNSASEIAVVRSGRRTTLTVANDVHGDTRDFAMVVPVPEVIGEDMIHVVDPTVFDHLRGYSAPREVSYDCADFEQQYDTDADTDSDSDSDSDTDADTDVQVEASYIVGEYDVQILAAEDSEALVDWLQAHGYAVPDVAERLLGDYIEGGSHFIAAQVRPEAGVEDGDTLSPLQFSYASEVFALPIRIGTLNSPGEQDLVVYAVNDYGLGAVGISNYDETQAGTDCMLEPEEDLDEHVAAELDDAFAAGSRATWVTEYAWGQGGCDPCTGDSVSPTDLASVGYSADAYGTYFLTRLHMRYTPERADADLSLYHSRDTTSRQLRYIQYDGRLEDRFPKCDGGWEDDPGTCDDPDGIEPKRTVGEWMSDTAEGCGCASGGGGGAFGLLGALALLRRRAQPSTKS